MANRVYPNNLTNPVVPLGYDGSDFRAILVDTTGKAIINVPSLPLPVGASTSANQVTEIARLTSLVAALASVAGDRMLTSDYYTALIANALASIASDYLRIVGQVYGSLSLPFLQDAVTGLLNAKVTSSVLPTGASTSANQSTEITALQNLVKALVATGGGADWLQVYAGWTGSAPSPIQVTATGQVEVHNVASVLASALPSGAATSAKQDTQITSLQLIDDLYNALATVATDKLRASVIDSALPSGASTSANQSTEITSLQKIDDLQNCLASINTDNLRSTVAWDGTNALFLRTDTNGFQKLSSLDAFGNFRWAYFSRYEDYGSDLNPAAGAVAKNLTTVPAGEVWGIRNVWGADVTTAKSIKLVAVLNGNAHNLVYGTEANTQQPITFNGDLVLSAGDNIRVVFVDNLLGDDLYWGCSGYKMKVA